MDCGADVNAKNESKSTPLHVASNPYNYIGNIVRILLDYGAHMDQPNRSGERPMTLIANNSNNSIKLMKYSSLKCIAASAIIKYKVPYCDQIPKTLEEFVELHRA